MKFRHTIGTFLLLLVYSVCLCQYLERVEFKTKDSTNSSYLASEPRSKKIKGTIVLLSSFVNLNWLTSQSKLHNVAYDNDLLFIYATLDNKIYADSGAINYIKSLFSSIASKFSVDTGKFVLGGWSYAGNTALRYTELSQQFPSLYSIKPKAVFLADAYTDLFAYTDRLKRQVRSNFLKEEVEAAKFLLDILQKNLGENSFSNERYKQFSPFNYQDSVTGHEKYLVSTPIRLYYDIDAELQLKKRNSFFDTHIPEGSELIRRLLLLGNKHAEFISSKQNAVNSRGLRDQNSPAIINEVECIHWVKQKLDIFDYNTWIPIYSMPIPKGWRPERHAIPTPWAPDMTYKGVLDMRFPGGWGDSTNQEFFSYTHLWWLDGKPLITPENLRDNLKKYFFGLSGGNRKNVSQIPNFVPTEVSIEKLKPLFGVLETYAGTITTFDSHVIQRQLKLNYRVHVRRCEDQKHTALLFEISPFRFDHKVWTDLSNILQAFECGF